MDGIGIIIEVAATVAFVGLGLWRIHSKLGDKIDRVKDEASACRSEISGLKSKVEDFPKICDARHSSLNSRISRLEKAANSKKEVKH
jgi:uncharacterized protein YdcH (DUF465 family)